MTVKIIGSAEGPFKTYDKNSIQECGGLVYPFLLGMAWVIENRPINHPHPHAATLRIVRDGKVVDILTDLKTDDFLAKVGLNLSLHKGTAALSKRLSRIFAPYRYWAFYDAAEVKIKYDANLNPDL